MLWSGSETPERQQDSSPCQAKSMPKECFALPVQPIENNALARLRNTTLPLEPIKNNAFQRQQDPSPCPAKRRPKECFTLPLKPIRNNALVRFRNTRTPAGFEHMPSKKHAERMLHTLPLEPVKNNALVRVRNTRTPAGVEPVPSKKHAHRMLPKASTSSRIRAQGMQNTSRKKHSCGPQEHMPSVRPEFYATTF